MDAKGMSWVGVKTESFEEMKRFFGSVVGLPVAAERADFAVFTYPNGDKLEVFGPAAGNPPEQFRTNEVMTSILVDDIVNAAAELKAAGIALVGELVRAPDGYAWQHFRAPDGKVFELVEDPAHP